MWESLDSRTLADQAYALIADAIVRGELKPNARMAEAALAKQFNISRGPLREALRRLEGRGLVVVRPNAGARVVSLSTRDVRELYEIRESLEALACQLATQRVTEDDLDALDALLAEHERDPSAGRASSRLASAPDFHTAVIRASGSNQLINLLCGELFDLMRVYRYRSSGEEGRTPDAFREHREIAAAMRARDAVRAAELMRQHVRRSRSNVLGPESVAEPEPAASTADAAAQTA
jgi:DNA-binding GntR family transcriptional regulator